MNQIPADARSSGGFWTISNLLSLLRIVLSIPFVLVLLARASWSRPWAIVILVLGALTDRYDGIIARRYHQESEWGRILDPLADKIGMSAALLVFLLLGDLPLWFVVVLITRDLLILIGGMFIKVRTGKVLPSIPAGKWAVGMMAMTLLVVLLGLPDALVNLFIAATILMVGVSSLLYLQKFVGVMRAAAAGEAHGNA